MINCRILVGFFLGLWWSSVGADYVGETSTPRVINNAHLLHVALTQTSPPHQEKGQWRVLPDRVASIPEGMIARYEARFNLRSIPPSTWAVYLSEISIHAAIFLNDRWVGAVHNPEHHRALTTGPLYLKIPAGFLRVGTNTLHIDLRATRGAAGYISRIHIGPAADLQQAFERQTFWRIKAPYIAQMTTTVIGVLFLLVGLGRRQERYLLWLASATAFYWMSRDAGLIAAVDVGFQGPTEAALFGLVICLVLFIHRYCGIRQTAHESTLAWIVPPLVLLALQPPLIVSGDIVSRLLAPSLITIVAYCIYIRCRHCRPFAARENALMAIVASLVAALSFYQWFIEAGGLGGENFHLYYLDIFILQIAVGGSLILKYLSRLQRSQALNEELTHLIWMRTHKLAAQHERLRKLERVQVLAIERKRMMKDLHDGIGSQLVSALILLEGREKSNTEVAACLRDTLGDLRLVLESLDSSHGDLCTALASLRPRIEMCLESKGMALRWCLADLPSGAINPSQALQILRIVQEAMANVMKHAGARTVTISGYMDTDNKNGIAVIIDIADDGVGFNPGCSSGKGIKSMATRAADIGGHLSIASTNEGTRIRLIAPLRPA